MKKFIAGLLMGIIVMATGTAYAEQIEVVIGQVKLVVDGRPVAQETLLYNGTTYIPLRAAASTLGKEVSYDDATKTAFIGETSDIKDKLPSMADKPIESETMSVIADESMSDISIGEIRHISGE